MTQTPKLSTSASGAATHASVAHPSSKADKADKAKMYATNPSGIVIGLTLSMGWQLAIVVLLPLLGGHFLDDHFDKAPLWTIIGLVVAMILMVAVVRHTLARLNEYTVSHESTDDKKDTN